jgi:hypothetical protein
VDYDIEEIRTNRKNSLIIIISVHVYLSCAFGLGMSGHGWFYVLPVRLNFNNIMPVSTKNNNKRTDFFEY